MSKADPTRHYKTNVKRWLDRKHGEAWSLEVQAKDGRSSPVVWMKGETGFINRTDYFKKLAWEGSVLKVYDRLDKAVFQVDVETILQ